MLTLQFIVTGTRNIVPNNQRKKKIKIMIYMDIFKLLIYFAYARVDLWQIFMLDFS